MADASSLRRLLTHVDLEHNPLEHERLVQLVLRAENGERREVLAGTARRMGWRSLVGRREVLGG